MFGVLGSDKNGERHSLEERGTEHGGEGKWRELESAGMVGHVLECLEPCHMARGLNWSDQGVGMIELQMWGVRGLMAICTFLLSLAS